MKTFTNYGYGKALKTSVAKERKETFREIFKSIHLKKSAVILIVIIFFLGLTGNILFKKIVKDFSNAVTHVSDTNPP